MCFVIVSNIPISDSASSVGKDENEDAEKEPDIEQLESEPEEPDDKKVEDEEEQP